MQREHVQEPGKYREDYPKDIDDLKKQEAGSNDRIGDKHDDLTDPSKGVSTSVGDDWFEQESGRITEQCQKRQERLKRLREMRAKQAVADAANGLAEEQKELKD